MHSLFLRHLFHQHFFLSIVHQYQFLPSITTYVVHVSSQSTHLHIYFPSTLLLSTFHQYLLLLPSIHHSVVIFFCQSTNWTYTFHQNFLYLLYTNTYYFYPPSSLLSFTFLSTLTQRILHMSRDMRFPIMWCVRPAKAQTSLRIRAV